ncbi:MAG: lipoyl(octanoyl) transferase [Flavobacteriales bacterium]|nr:lipoyl(octanoyl) transferase [Flavobacteriales bacterium]|tara:strand:- start:12504 stop:13199 length:696 start_codon:yes stop_codon:yes gene_type:complete
MNKNVDFIDLGLIDYKKCWDYQEVLFAKILKTKSLNRNSEEQLKTENYFIFCEHPNVYTLGKSGDEKNLLVSKQDLLKKNADFYKINRGGDITFHGPGQIVGYPIFDLDNFFTDIHKYLRLLEEAVILTLNEYGVFCGRSKGETGVWVDAGKKNARKICALGVRTSRWVTMHGFALNVNTDLDYFNNIIPCGISNKKVTSIKNELDKQLKLEDVKKKLKCNLIRVFKISKD